MPTLPVEEIKIDDVRRGEHPCMECGWPGTVPGTLGWISLTSNDEGIRKGWFCDEHADMSVE